jgi:hypothetical protein
MSVGEYDSPWPAAVWVAAAAAGSDADAAGAVEGETGDAALAVDAAWPVEAAGAGDATGSVEDVAALPGQCFAHSFGEAKLLRQKSRPRV